MLLAGQFTDCRVSKIPGLVLRRYWTNTPAKAALSSTAAPAAKSDGSRVGSTSTFSKLVQRRLASHPEKMRQWRETVQHPLGTLKACMAATHFLMKTLPRVATEMVLHVLAYYLTRVMNITGLGRLIAAIQVIK